MSNVSVTQSPNQNGTEDDSGRKIFIGGLTNDITIQQVKDYFNQFGEVDTVDFKMDKFTGQSRGYGFVTFIDGNVANSLLSSVTQHFIGSKKIDVKKVAKKNRLDCKIFVGGISQDTTETDVRDYFSQFGTIIEFEQPYDKTRNMKKNFCFLTFSNPNEVKMALQSPKQTVNGKQVDVKSVIFNPETMGNKNGRRPKVNPAPVYYGYDTASAAAGYIHPSVAYESYGPAYGGYDYNALGYDPSALGYVAPQPHAVSGYSRGRFKDSRFRFTPY